MKFFMPVGAALLLWGATPHAQALKIGVVPGPDAKIMAMVKDVAAQDGLDIEVVQASDPAQLNATLDIGALDANACQHLPFLESQIKTHGYKLTAVGYTITLPMGVYSKTIKSLRELKPHDAIAIPQDRINGARALILLHNYGLLELTDGVGLDVTPQDITANPRGLKLVQFNPDNLTDALPTAVAIALTYDLGDRVGLSPARDAIALEDGRSPYAGILVTRAQDKGQPWVAKLLNAYHSDLVKAYILKEFKDSVRPPW